MARAGSTALAAAREGRAVGEVAAWRQLAASDVVAGRVRAAGLGLAATGWALERKRAANDAAQVDRPALNDQIHRLNVASWVLYGVAAALAHPRALRRRLRPHQPGALAGRHPARVVRRAGARGAAGAAGDQRRRHVAGDGDLSCDGDGEAMGWRDAACFTCVPLDSHAVACASGIEGVDCRAWPYPADGVAGAICGAHEDCEPGLLCGASSGDGYGICQCPDLPSPPSPAPTCS